MVDFVDLVFALVAFVVDLADLLVVDLLTAFLVVDFALFGLTSFVAFSFFCASFIASISALSKYKIRPQCGQVVIESALNSSK